MYAQLDEDNKVELKTFMLDLYRLQRRRVQDEDEMQNKLKNAKNFIKQTEDPDFMVKNSDFIDVVYEEFRSPSDAKFLKEFGRFLEELWEERNPKPRVKVMRIKKTKDQKDHGSEEESEERRNERARKFLIKVKGWLEEVEEDEEKFDQQYFEHKETAQGLDVEIRHQFYLLVDQNRAEVRRQKMQRRCDRPRSLYAGAFEGNYHFHPCCKEINQRSHYEWKSCPTCFKEIEEMLEQAMSESSSSTESWVKDFEFELRGTRFHSSKCTEAQIIPEGDKDKKIMCQCCVKEERIRAEAHRKNKEYYMKA